MYFDDKNGIWVFTSDSTLDDIIRWYDMGKPECDIDETYYWNNIYMQVLEEGKRVDIVYDEPRRWTRWCEVIIEYNGRYFSVGYDEGLTECQENEYNYSDIIEVIPKEEVITVRKWVNKGEV